jgi:hypothetical protein
MDFCVKKIHFSAIFEILSNFINFFRLVYTTAFNLYDLCPALLF